MTDAETPAPTVHDFALLATHFLEDANMEPQPETTAEWLERIVWAISGAAYATLALSRDDPTQHKHCSH